MTQARSVSLVQGYTQQRELCGCDAFDISHEGSFSLMVNLHALGLLAACWGGTSFHTRQCVTEQGAGHMCLSVDSVPLMSAGWLLVVDAGDTCLATSAIVVDSTLLRKRDGNGGTPWWEAAAAAWSHETVPSTREADVGEGGGHGKGAGGGLDYADHNACVRQLQVSSLAVPLCKCGLHVLIAALHTLLLAGGVDIPAWPHGIAG